MSDELHVEPASLRHVGRQLNQGAEEGRESFAKQHGQLTAAAAGLFDKWRSALESKADVWRTRAAALTDRVDEHGTHMHTSAALVMSRPTARAATRTTASPTSRRSTSRRDVIVLSGHPGILAPTTRWVP